MQITVKAKSVYGTTKIYPVCEKAGIFCDLIGQRTLTLEDIRLIRKLGVDVIEEAQVYLTTGSDKHPTAKE